MNKSSEYTRRSVAIDSDMYEQVELLAAEADTTKGAVASAIIRIGLKYYRARWTEFLRQHPELAPNGREDPYTTTVPVVPRR